MRRFISIKNNNKTFLLLQQQHIHILSNMKFIDALFATELAVIDFFYDQPELERLVRQRQYQQPPQQQVAAAAAAAQSIFCCATAAADVHA